MKPGVKHLPMRKMPKLKAVNEHVTSMETSLTADGKKKKRGFKDLSHTMYPPPK